MMKRYALVKSGLVNNVVLWNGDGDANFGDGVQAIECDDSVRIGFSYNGTSFIDPHPVNDQSLADAQTAQIGANSAACQAAITAGFQSSALGSWHTYPSQMTDQQNLNASVVASLIPGIPATWVTPFKCQDAAGNWALVYHTAEQIRKVGQDGKSAILTLLNRNAQLQAQVMAATTVEDVYKVTW